MKATSPALPNKALETGTLYTGHLDDLAAAMARLAGAFAPYANIAHGFIPASVDATGDKITIVRHRLLNAMKGQLTTTGTLPPPLALATTYWIIGATSDTFQFSATEGGAAINLTDGGSGNHTFTRTADMKVAIAAGVVAALAAIPTEVAAALTAAFTAPTVNPRNDIIHIDAATGAHGVAAGAEAASPSDPAVPAGKLAVARVRLTVGMAQITNADLDDLRGPWLIGIAAALAGGGLQAPAGQLALNIGGLTSNAGPGVADEVALLIAGNHRRVRLDDILKVINGLTEDASPDLANDFLVSYDASALAAKKVKPNKLASGLTLGTPQATTSGNSVTLSSTIPAGIKIIFVMLNQVSLTAEGLNIGVQIGDAGGPEVTGYIGAIHHHAGTPTVTNLSASFLIVNAGVDIGATGTWSGVLALVLQDASDFTWAAYGGMGAQQAAYENTSGVKSLSAELTSVTLITSGTFDAGEASVAYM